MGWIGIVVFICIILGLIVVRLILNKEEREKNTQTNKPQETKYDEWKKYFVQQQQQQQETEEEICKRIGNEGEEEVADILGWTIVK